jgi:hypothetical protein
MSADADEVMALRRRTAADLFAKIPKPVVPTEECMMAVGEVIGYACEGEYEDAWKAVAKGMHERLDSATDAELEARKDALLKLRNSLDALVKAGVVPQSCGTRRRINAIALRLGWEK